MEQFGRQIASIYEDLGAPAMELSTADGGIHHWFPRAGLVVNRMWGVMTIPIVQRIKVASDHNADTTPDALIGFGDWCELTNWETQAREAVWSVRAPYWHRTKAIHLLVNSISLPLARSAAVLEKSITVHETRETYDRALREVLAEPVVPLH